MHLRYIQRSLPVKDTLKCIQTNNNNKNKTLKSVQVQSFQDSKFLKSSMIVQKKIRNCGDRKFEIFF